MKRSKCWTGNSVCTSCDRIIPSGELAYLNTRGPHIINECQECSEKENLKCGDCIHFQPAWLCKKVRGIGDKNSPVNNCSDFERKTMSTNIKITAEVNGEKVPLNTISDETFAEIKALEKSEEIPVARIGNYGSEPRLFVRISESVERRITDGHDDVVVVDLTDGDLANSWPLDCDQSRIKDYENVKSL